MTLPPKHRAPALHRALTVLRTRQDMSAQDMVAALRCSRARAYQILVDLEDRGLAERITDPSGRRVALWKATTTTEAR